MTKETRDLLRAVRESGDKSCALIADDILTAEVERQDELIVDKLKYADSFMAAVLNGDGKEALKRADSMNREALDLAGLLEYLQG